MDLFVYYNNYLTNKAKIIIQAVKYAIKNKENSLLF